MNTSTHDEHKNAVTKSFAIVGFVALILFAVWLAVQIVSLIPSAFGSLASIADGVYNYEGAEEQFIVATERSVVNSEEPFTISWTEHRRDGDYTFSYACTDGAALQIVDGAGNRADLACDTPVALGTNTAVSVAVASEKQRFTDIDYTITFTDAETGTVSTTDASTTIVNASIPTSIVLGEETTTEKEEVVEETTEAIVEEPTTPATPVAGTPTTVEEVIYAIPTSNPNGTVDLAVDYVGVGILTGNNTFAQTGTIDVDQTGAFRFEVTNLGTKTSDEWSFEALLPSGIEYTSGDQVALKPNETAVITIGFDGLSQTGVERFSADISVDDDTNTSNNGFISAVKVVN